tara:strand:- start:313 stop:465 length:153 start_codon:yes stop_codon:yes gene_type:complete
VPVASWAAAVVVLIIQRLELAAMLEEVAAMAITSRGQPDHKLTDIGEVMV